MAELVYDKFILFGDSITQFSCAQDGGYGLTPALQSEYVRKLDVINRGFTGYNSDHARLVLPKILEAESNEQKNNIKVMTIFFGTNDAFQVEDDFNKIQAVPLNRYQENLCAMIELALEYNIYPIIIGPALHHDKLGRKMLREGGRPTDKPMVTNERYLEYSESAKAVAAQYNVGFVDCWHKFKKYEGWPEEQVLDHFISDGIHFTPPAYEVLTAEVSRAVSLSQLEFKDKFSSWDEVRIDDLPSSMFVPTNTQLDPPKQRQLLSYDKFIMLGDSLTEFSCDQSAPAFGLMPALQNEYIRKLDVLNRGYGGYNSEMGKHLLRKILTAELNSTKDNIKLLTIFFGTNDAFQINDELNKIQAVSLKQYKQNLSEMIEMALENNIRPIIIGPGLHDHELAVQFFGSFGRKVQGKTVTNKRLFEYSEGAKEVADKYNVAFVDLWNAFRIDGGWSTEQLLNGNENAGPGRITDYLTDGIHFKPLGYAIAYEEVMKAIRKHYPSLSPEKMPEILSDWADIDPKDIEASVFRSSYKPGEIIDTSALKEQARKKND
ncbi:IAH1 [[Candida] subhashii]|uniref:IAH1 n=1 Tax=[Candida] subhashii TaxID=561895 RepID=A0A8J5QNY6_9ASCO|nr:IAH1 [[Candida] subhashii]KAG7663870.1 IAH1 [[Candida] subhashii]